MADVNSIAPMPNYIGQIVQGDEEGTQAGQALIQAAQSGPNMANTLAATQLQRAQIPLVQAQTQGAQQSNAMQALRMQYMQSQMSYAQHLISSMNQGPINDDGSSSAVGSVQAAQLQDADDSGDTPGAAGATAPQPASSAPPGVSTAAASIVAGASAPADGTAPGTGTNQGPAGAPLTLADVKLDPGHIDSSVRAAMVSSV